jgi:predicted N-acyltransferase
MTPSASPAARPAPRIDVRDDVPLEEIPSAQWDALAPDHPLLSHAFLHALHASGCASRATGWRPRYLTAWRSGALVGAMPLYEKMHSYGEYVFDWGWAEAYRRHGRRYYPKLVSAVPFTPVSGPRLIADEPAVRRMLLDHALAQVEGGTFSSLHLLFLDDRDTAATAGMTRRVGVQFRWINRNYRDFADFLSTFTHDKRKKVKQDRRKVADASVHFERRVGNDISGADWAFFYRCYESTYRAHHSTPYLTPVFFERIAAAMPEHLLLVVGKRAGRRVCVALDVFTSQTLWGRYWGAIDTIPGLHFEACYYQAIEFCIERGIASFEGGAQGLHKLARGLAPMTTHSAHAIADAAFAQAIADYCVRERVEISHSLGELQEAMPYKRG